MGLTNSQAVLLLWGALSLLLLAGIAAAAVWAIRSGQFRHQQRARHLALWSGSPSASGQAAEGRDGRTPS
jgi:nitrogen fixation-related uncharacterized protein